MISHGDSAIVESPIPYFVSIMEETIYDYTAIFTDGV